MSAKDDFYSGLQELIGQLGGDDERIREVSETSRQFVARPEDAEAFEKFMELGAGWEFLDDEWKVVGGGWTVERVAAFFDLTERERAVGIMKAEEAWEKRAKAPSPPPPAAKPAPAAAAAPSPVVASVKAAPADDKEKARLRAELERVMQERNAAIASAADAEVARAEAQARLDAMADPAEYERELNRVREIVDAAQRAAAESNRDLAAAADRLAAEAEAGEQAAATALADAARREEDAFQAALADRLREVNAAGASDINVQQRNRQRREREHHQKALDQILDHDLHAAEERLHHAQREEDKWQKHMLHTETRGNSRARVVMGMNLRRRPGDPERTYDPVTQVVGPRRPPSLWDRFRDGFANLFF